MPGLGILGTLACDTVNVDGIDTALAIKGAVIIHADLVASNGALHCLDQLFIPSISHTPLGFSTDRMMATGYEAAGSLAFAPPASVSASLVLPFARERRFWLDASST